MSQIIQIFEQEYQWKKHGIIRNGFPRVIPFQLCDDLECHQGVKGRCLP
jgi:hypothetical protein